MPVNRRFLYSTLIIAAIGCTFLLNEWNLNILSGVTDNKQILLETADTPSYFAPPEEFLKHGTWKERYEGSSAYFTRTPGYGLIYFICFILNPSNPFILLKFIQLALFGGSVSLFSQLLKKLVISEKTRLITTIIYAFLPAFSGFVYYQLSESVIPFFILWNSYSFAGSLPDKRIQPALVLSTAFLILVRPQLIIFPLLFLILDFSKRNFRSLSILIGFVPFLLWQARTVQISKTWLGIHPIYATDNHSLFRPPHRELTRLFGIWECDGALFHQQIYKLHSDTSSSALNEVIEEIPQKFHSSVRPVLRLYQLNELKVRESESGQLDQALPGENALTVRIHTLSNELIWQYPVDYFIKTPARSLKKLLFTSMMNLNLFQDMYKSNLLVMLLKILTFGIILSGLLSGVLLIFNTQIPGFLRILVLGVFFSIFYLAFFQRFNEERYIYPYLPFFLVFIAYFFSNRKQQFNSF